MAEDKASINAIEGVGPGHRLAQVRGLVTSMAPQIEEAFTASGRALMVCSFRQARGCRGSIGAPSRGLAQVFCR